MDNCKIEERRSKYPNRRLIQKLDNNGNYVENPILVEIIRDDKDDGTGFEGILQRGTSLTVNVLNELIKQQVRLVLEEMRGTKGE